MPNYIEVNDKASLLAAANALDFAEDTVIVLRTKSGSRTRYRLPAHRLGDDVWIPCKESRQWPHGLRPAITVEEGLSYRRKRFVNGIKRLPARCFK